MTSTENTTDLDRRLEEIARVPVLLIASDYDGTLAPIVDEPGSARPHREAVVALRSLAGLAQTHVAVISGRALRELARLTGLPEDVHLVGSHGSEYDLDFSSSLSPEVAALRDRIRAELADAAASAVGMTIEEKPASVALHYRQASSDDARRVLDEVLAGPAAIEGVVTKHGKKVLELGVVSTNKGDALENIRRRVGASAVIFLGDDVTDEDAFATLTGPDIAVKVGEGETSATFRVSGPEDVARLLARLSELRSKWLEDASAEPIEQHSLLSDQRTAALVTSGGRITWLCVPRIDSAAIFAELIGGPAAGHFTIRPAKDDKYQPTQEYLENSLVLRTNWGTFSVTDYLDASAGRTQQRAGRTELVRVIDGTGRVHVEFSPRLDFGRTQTRLHARQGGLIIGDTHDPLVLRSPGVGWELIDEGPHQTARAEIELRGKPVVMELRYGTGSLRDGSAGIEQRIDRTQHVWSSWAQLLEIPDVAPDLVRRSALVLKGLCYGPTGAVAAAATTSLPEHLGGVRNWDYRFCWLRDAAMSVHALVRLGSFAEAMHFLDWVLGVIDSDECESPERLKPLYDVTGRQLGPEAEITELPGYRGSRPVRIGNAASRQVQLDVFGPIVDLVAELIEHDAPLSSQHWRLVEAMVQAVERRWQEADHGIWEIRRPPRHHVHSKVMCWLTVDRAIRIAERLLDRDHPQWRALRDAIAEEVLEKGFKKEVNAFTAAYDDIDLDAATLHVGLTGLLPPDDPRFSSTVEAIEQHLLCGQTVYRYRTDDGLPGFEGGFHICASWLVNSYILLGRHDDARELFDRICRLAGPTGMLSEQYGPRTRRALGNTPQAYSHLGIIDNAVHFAALESSADRRNAKRVAS